MRRALMMMAAAAVCLAGPAFAADKAGKYEAPKTSWGAPDLSGNWTNATLTPQVRPTLYGTRKVQTPEEVRLLEGANDEKTVKGNAKVDVNAAESASDNVGAYDRAWIDNGIRVMRVNGEPRTSLITTPDGAPHPAGQRRIGGRGPAGGQERSRAGPVRGPRQRRGRSGRIL